MRKMLVLFVLFAFVIGSMAYATDTRVTSMGMVNNIVKDDANIWMYPSTINYYPNIFVGEIGETYGGPSKAEYDELWNVGANFGFGQDGESPWVLGAYFSTEPYYHSIIGWWDKTEYYADQRINLFYGRKLGEMPFGLSIGYYGNSYKNEDTDMTDNYEDGLSRYEFAFGISPMDGKMDIALGFAFTSWTDKDYRQWTATDSGSVDITKPNGNLDIGLTARYWMDPMGNATLVPHLEIVMLKQGLDDFGDTGTEWENTYTYKTTETYLGLGLGMNYEADEDVMVVSDFGIILDNWKREVDDIVNDTTYENKDNYFILPYFKLGIDAYVFKWMDFRAGVIAQWERNTWEPDIDQKRVYSYSETWTYLGAGIHWGNFEIDAIIAPEFLTNGPYFISGQQTDGDYDGLANRVSLKYNFD